MYIFIFYLFIIFFMNLSLDPFHWQYIDPSCNNNGQQEVQYKMFCELGSSTYLEDFAAYAYVLSILD